MLLLICFGLGNLLDWRPALHLPLIPYKATFFRLLASLSSWSCNVVLKVFQNDLLICQRQGAVKLNKKASWGRLLHPNQCQDPLTYQSCQLGTKEQLEAPGSLKYTTSRGGNVWGVGTGKAGVIKGDWEWDKGVTSRSADTAENKWRNNLSIPATWQYLNWNQCVKLPVAIYVSNVLPSWIPPWEWALCSIHLLTWLRWLWNKPTNNDLVAWK